MPRSFTLPALATLAFGAVAAAAVTMAAQVSPVHEGPSLSIPASQIKFVKSGVKTEKGELQAGPAYGDLQTGRHGTFIRMPAGFVSRPHTHTEDYFGVVIQGVGANGATAKDAKPLASGSYWFQRGEEQHVTQCLSETDCLFFIVQPGKFDYLEAK